MAIAPYDRESLRHVYQHAEPFPHVMIDGFLQPDAAAAAARSFFSPEEARAKGFEFHAVNENLKIQIVDPGLFPAPITAVADAFSAPEFLKDLEYITGIDNLIWDPTYAG
jgi:hypothetical protein